MTVDDSCPKPAPSWSASAHDTLAATEAGAVLIADTGYPDMRRTAWFAICGGGRLRNEAYEIDAVIAI